MRNFLLRFEIAKVASMVTVSRILFKPFTVTITLLRVLLNRAPTSTQLHPPPPSSLQHLQQYLNQNIARNWPISLNLGRKIKSCLFWLKSGTHGILEVLIWKQDLDLKNSDHKILFWANLGPKFKVDRLIWKLVHIVPQGCWFRIQTYIFKLWPRNPFLGKFGPKNSRFSIFSENWCTWYLKDADAYSNTSFLNFKS